MRALGIPYAYVTDDGRGRICPVCREVLYGVDESQRTAEDAVTKGSGAVYAEHYMTKHES